ncbi:hypothetical protein Q4595_23375, partial [Wenyingzhuangia sp. 1_MG-2023]|nr:hypothetical protein [Wenyingzhuangia sp. 1_MG-2023]
MKKITGYLSALLMALLLPAMAYADTLRLGLITPPSHQWTLAAKAFAADLEKSSDGKLKVLVFPSGQL